MYLWLILAFAFAILEAIAVSRNLYRLEYITKPAVMVFLFVWLYSNTGLHRDPFWFGVGILFSLVGDVLLIVPLESMFLLGLIAFLFAQISYIIGFKSEFTTINAWSFILLLLLAITVSRLLQRIVLTMRAKGEKGLIVPVIIYGTVISVMLYAAMSTVYDPEWKTSAAFFASLGALLFWTSDLILAWNKFVSPVSRLSSIVLYHLGQIGLIAGVIAQFR